MLLYNQKDHFSHIENLHIDQCCQDLDDKLSQCVFYMRNVASAKPVGRYQRRCHATTKPENSLLPTTPRRRTYTLTGYWQCCQDLDDKLSRCVFYTWNVATPSQPADTKGGVIQRSVEVIRNISYSKPFTLGFTALIFGKHQYKFIDPHVVRHATYF